MPYCTYSHSPSFRTEYDDHGSHWYQGPTVTVLHSEQNMMIMVVTGTKDAGTQSHVSCNAH